MVQFGEFILLLPKSALFVLLIVPQLLELLFSFLDIVEVPLLDFLLVLFFVLFKLLLPFVEYILQQVSLLFHLKPLHSDFLLFSFFTFCSFLMVRVQLGQQEKG